MGPFSRRFPKAQVWVAPRCARLLAAACWAWLATVRLQAVVQLCTACLRFPLLHPPTSKTTSHHPLPARHHPPTHSQWSWPINLPVQFFGIFPTGVLRSDADDTPWADEIEQKVFESSVGIGPYIEAAFYHKKSRTLLVTDAVVSVPNTPPEVRWAACGWPTKGVGVSEGVGAQVAALVCGTQQQQQQLEPPNRFAHTLHPCLPPLCFLPAAGAC